MGVTIIPPFWPFARSTPVQRAKAEAERLIGLWGEAAHTIAAELSSREDLGLLRTSTPGHWAAVTREVGLALGLGDGPAFDQARVAA